MLNLKRKFRILNAKITLSSIFITTLILSLIFAPMITLHHPNFQKDVAVTKLLPPFSEAKFLKLNIEENESGPEDLQTLKSKVIFQPFDNSIEYFDSLEIGESNLVLYKNLGKKVFNKSEVIMENGQVKIFSMFYLLGTDHLGRDVLSMLIYGSRTSMLVGTTSLVIVLILGITLGFAAAYWGGFLDILISRLSDIFLAFPSIFLVLLVLALFGNNLFSVIIVLGFSGWMSLFRIVKGEVLIVKEKDYILTSQLLGLSKSRIFLKDIMPVISSPILVNLVLQFANIILAESTLSFLGLGVGVEYNSWGSLIQSGQEYLTKGWWMILLPGITLILTLFSFNSIANAINQKYNPLLSK